MLTNRSRPSLLLGRAILRNLALVITGAALLGCKQQDSPDSASAGKPSGGTR